MTTSVPLYQPLNTLKPVADDIWIADGGIVQKGLYERIFMLCRLRDRKVKIFVFVFFFFDFADELFEF